MASQHHRHVHRWHDPQGWETAQIDVSGRGNGEPAFLQGYPLAVEPKIEIDRIYSLTLDKLPFLLAKLEKSWN
jgi:hypothetical protein